MRPTDTSLEDPLPDSPLPLLARWLDEAKASDAIRNHDAVALATVDSNARPHVRMVLARRFDFARGSFSFYTNRESPKALQIEGTGRASAAIYWDAMARQVRLDGHVGRTSEEDSDAYFASRPPRSQVAAWASAQSEPIPSRAALIDRFDEVATRFGGPDTIEKVPRPHQWGGYLFQADRIELWVDRPDRLHDRAVWLRTDDSPSRVGSTPSWRVERLQP